MYVKVNRDTCGTHLAVCERCLGRFLEYPMGYERRCFEEVREDGNEDLTIDLINQGQEVRLVLDEKQRHMMAGEGWATMVDFAVDMYRNNNT